MASKRFTLAWIEGNEQPLSIPDGFDTIDEARQWCDDNRLDYYLLTVTEWDVENLDFYGTPEIIASCNLSGPIEDGQTDLSFYQFI